jgi:protein TonB
MVKNKKTRFAPFESPSWSLLATEESTLNRATREFFTETVDTTQLTKQRNPKADLKSQHKKVFEISLSVTLVFLIGMAQLARQFSLPAEQFSNVAVKIEVADIPQTEQFRRPPAPPKPSVPVPTEEETVPEDLTIDFSELDLSEIPPPPPPSGDDELTIFMAYDQPPQIIGGLAELNKYLSYPRVAQDAGVEGVVFVRVLVGVKGNVEKIEILKAKPANIGFEESAMKALRQVRWEPAKQRDKSIRVWISIPIHFELVS